MNRLHPLPDKMSPNGVVVVLGIPGRHNRKERKKGARSALKRVVYDV